LVSKNKGRMKFTGAIQQNVAKDPTLTLILTVDRLNATFDAS